MQPVAIKLDKKYLSVVKNGVDVCHGSASKPSYTLIRYMENDFYTRYHVYLTHDMLLARRG